MDLRSALDRLMDDVAGAKVDTSMLTDEDPSFEHHPRSSLGQNHVEPEGSDSALLHQDFASREASVSSVLLTPPPPPPKDNIRNREQMIREKRREARRTGGKELDEITTVPRLRGKARDRGLLGVGRPGRRRSLSAGDVDQRPPSKSRSAALD